MPTEAGSPMIEGLIGGGFWALGSVARGMLASDRVQRLAFGMLATAVVAIIATAVTLILRG
jgi:hypothetical protein